MTIELGLSSTVKSLRQQQNGGASNGDESGLYRGTRLAQAFDWREQHVDELNVDEREFLDAGVAMRDREQAAIDRRRRRDVSVLTGGLTITVVLMLLFGWQWRRAEGQRRLALARQLYTQSQFAMNTTGEGLVSSVLLAVESLNTTSTPEALALLTQGLDVLSRPPLPPVWAPIGVNVNAVAFSRDGRWLAIGAENSIVVRDAATGKDIVRLPDQQQLRSVVFSPDGRWLVAGGFRGARVWETSSWRQVGALRHGDRVWSLAFSPDSRWLSTASYHSSFVKVFRSDGWVEADSLRARGSLVRGVAFSPDGALLAISADAVTIWNFIANPRRPVATVTGPGGPLAFSADGQWLATAGQGSVPLWKVTRGTGRDSVTFDEESDKNRPRIDYGSLIGVVAFSPDGRYLATGGVAEYANGKGAVHVWDVASHREVMRIVAAIRSFAFSPDGLSLATGDQSGVVALWRLLTGPDIARLNYATSGNGVAFDAADKWLAIGSADSTVRVFETGTWRQVISQRFDREASSTAFSPDHRWLAVTRESTVSVFETGSWKRSFERGLPSPIARALFSPDSKSLLTIGNGTVGLFRTANWTAVSDTKTDGDVTAVSFSPDGKWVALDVRTPNPRARGDVTKTTVWDLSTGRGISWSVPDRDTTGGSAAVVAAGTDTPNATRGARVMLSSDPKTWPTIPTAAPDSVRSPNGRWIAVAGADSVIRIHALWAKELTTEACSRLAGALVPDSLISRRERACPTQRGARK